MYVKKKGFVLIEVMLLINFIMILISLSVKSIVVSRVKSSYYHYSSDLLIFTEDEYKLIQEIKEEISNNEEIIDKFESYKENNALKYKFISKDDANRWVEISEGKVYLVHKNLSGKKYNEIDIKWELNEDKKDFIIIPKKYCTNYIKG